jgi:CHAT domain-containing protein/Tfp pilus assembly protein PilF
MDVSADDSQTQDPTALKERAYEIYETTGPREALPLFKQALELYRQEDDRSGEAITLGFIGNCYKRLGNYPEALGYHDRALTLKRELGDRREEGRTLSHIGLVYWEMGAYVMATDRFKASIDIANEINDQRLRAGVLNNLSLVYDELGEYTKSLEGYKEALEVYQKNDLQSGEADVLANIGGTNLLLGRFSSALDYYRRALAIDRRLDYKPGISASLGNIAICHLGLGEFEAALNAFDEALLVAQQAGLHQEEAYWLRDKGYALIHSGRYDLGLDLYRQSLQLTEESGSRGELAEALNQYGELLLRLGDLAGAEEHFKRAQALAEEIGQHRGVTQALISLGDLHWYRKQYSKAAAFYGPALERAESVDDLGRAIDALIQLASTYGELGRFHEATERANRARSSARESELRLLEARALIVLGELELAQSKYAQALNQYAAGMEVADSLGDPDLLWRLYFGEARALDALGETEQAVDALQHAVLVIESVRRRLKEERFRAGYLEDKYAVYVELVRLLLELGKVDEAFSASETLRSRSFQELLDRAYTPVSLDAGQRREEVVLRARIRRLQKELEEEQQSPAADQRQAAIQTFSAELVAAERDYQELLDDVNAETSDPGAVIDGAGIYTRSQVQKLLGPGDSILAFVLTEDRIEATSIHVRRRNLQAKVELLRELLLIKDNSSWRKPSQSLANLLITPIENEGWLQGIDQLYLVPHGVLHYLPFAVLLRHISGQNRYLVQDYEIAYLPSAALLGQKAAVDAPVSILALAPESAELEHTVEEAQNVSELFAEAGHVLTGADATEESFKRLAPDYGVLHLATHGTFNKFNPLLSAVELEAGAGDDGHLQVHEILNLDLQADLVTLSACETALASGYFADVPAGDEFVGLTRAFLLAGGQSILASLWEVNDRSTLEFMVDFYRSLDKKDKAGSLSQVQRQMSQSEGSYQHPYYWGPFVLIGTMDKNGHQAGKPGALSVKY